MLKKMNHNRVATIKVEENLTPEDKMKRQMYFWQTDPLGPKDWMEKHICVAVPSFKTGISRYVSLGELSDEPHPITGRDYKAFWEWQCENVITPMHERDGTGFYKYRTIVLVTQRGVSKTFMNAFSLLYRFYTMPRQRILLGSNSVSQSKFSMYDTLTDIIRNSPKLMAILGPENIREKDIVLRNSRGEQVSLIRTVSSSTGILSNLTAVNFTEFFQQRPDAPFFSELDSSRRGIVNSMMYVDSTVSTKNHQLYKLYEASPLRKNTDPSIFFFYSFSKKGLSDDYVNPSMTQSEIDSFRAKMPPTEFRKLFLNLWSDDDASWFNPALIKAMSYIGHSGHLGQHQKIKQACKKIVELETDENDNPYHTNQTMIKDIEEDLMPIPYSLEESGHPAMATIEDLNKLSDLYDTDFAILCGSDRADMLKDDITLGARTIFTAVAKGLPGSRSNPEMHLTDGKVKYIYFLVHLAHVETSELADIQFQLDLLIQEYGVVKTLCSERWGMSEILTYCEENEIEVELVSPTNQVQRSSFNELYSLVSTGYFKTPVVHVAGYEEDNILREEMLSFRHFADKKFYGSETKSSSSKPQDDVMFSLALCIYGGRTITPDDFGLDAGPGFFGFFIPQKNIGNYGR